MSCLALPRGSYCELALQSRLDDLPVWSGTGGLSAAGGAPPILPAPPMLPASPPGAAETKQMQL